MAATEEIEFLTTDAELLAAFDPYVVRKFHVKDSEWQDILKKTAQAQAAARRRRHLVGWLRPFRRTQRSVQVSYLQQWADIGMERQLDGKLKAHYLFRDQPFEAFTQGEKRIHHRLLFRAVERLRPRSVLEVGCGNGLNILTLAARFPDVSFSGLEVTASGVQAAAAIRSLPGLPRVLAEFSIDPPRTMTGHCGVRLIQGTAEALPFPDASFDFVFTVLALEQMEEIRNAALSEIRRVSREFVLMIEPFRDWNPSGIRRDYIIANDYFSAKVSDLTEFRLQPVITDEIPAKLARGAGLVAVDS